MWNFGLAAENLRESDEKAAGKLSRPPEVLPGILGVWTPNDLLTCDELPEDYQDKYIQSGYRPPGISAVDSVLSLLQWNNETINFWSHYLTLLYFLWKICLLNISFFSDPRYWPLLCFAIGGCGYPIFSCVAHTFSAMSLSVRHICFFFDYAGVSLYSIGTAISIYAYSLPHEIQTSYPGQIFLPLNAVFAVVSCVICCLSRDSKFRETKSLMHTVAFGVPYAFITSFVLYRIFFSTFSNAIRAHCLQFFWAIMIALSNTSKFPEKFFPRKFDIIGQSHQWFHLFVAITTTQHTNAILEDIGYLQKSSGVPIFPFMSSVGLMLLVFVLDFLIVLYFSRRMLQHQLKVK